VVNATYQFDHDGQFYWWRKSEYWKNIN